MTTQSSFGPLQERSAHTAVGEVIISTCTVSTLSHKGQEEEGRHASGLVAVTI